MARNVAPCGGGLSCKTGRGGCSDEEEDEADNTNLADPPADLEDQPEPPADDEPEVVEEEESPRPKKRKRANPLPDDDYEDEVAELSRPINSRSSPIKVRCLFLIFISFAKPQFSRLVLERLALPL